MLFEKALPELLGHIDTRALGRKADMMALVARLALPPYWTPISPETLQVEGRTKREARYDHELLVKLALEHHVLLRARLGGQRSDLWAMVPDIDRWRGINWITPRPEVWRLLLARECSADPRLTAKIAAKGMRTDAPTPGSKNPEVAMLSVVRWSPTSEGWSSKSAAKRKTRGGLVIKSTKLGAPYSAYRSFSSEEEKLPSFFPNQGTRESAELSEAARRVAGVIVDSHRPEITNLRGEPRRRIAAAVDAHPEKLHRFLAAARTPGTIWSVVEAIESAAELPAEDQGAGLGHYRAFEPEMNLPPVDPDRLHRLAEIKRAVRGQGAS